MTTLAMPAQPSRALPKRDRSLLSDDRGAIMVLGIFMCTTMVGALWYLAGLGDALIYHERMQEAADAAGYSGAVLHARGMNIIVLINLIMACILGIRVALKMLQAVLILAAGIFFVMGIFLEPFEIAAGICADAAVELQTVIDDLRDPINDALKALHTTEVGIARVTPGAACIGGTMVGEKFKPTVEHAVSAVDAMTVANGLPLEDGTEDRLCYEAGQAVGSLLGWALGPIGISDGPKNWLKGALGDLAAAGAAYFCEMGSGGAPPDFSKQFDDAANDHCDKQQDKLNNDANAARNTYQGACASAGVVCDSTGPIDGGAGLTTAQRNDIESKRLDWNTKQQTANSFDHGQCVKDDKKDMNDKMKKAQDKANSHSSGGSGGSGNMKPLKICGKKGNGACSEGAWNNGINRTQILGWAYGNTAKLEYSPKLVKIGALNNAKAGNIDIPTSAKLLWSQAEYFYDCSGAWNGNDCNGARGDGEESMWHFRWRARLRRYNRPYTNLEFLDVVEAPWHLSFSSAYARALAHPLSAPNPILLGELAKFNIPQPRMIVVH